jgi:hypothetical protein
VNPIEVVKQDVNVNVEKHGVYSMHYSPAADDDPDELEKEELERLINELILNGKGKTSNRRESSFGIQGTQLTNDHYTLNFLKMLIEYVNSYIYTENIYNAKKC